MTTDSEITLTPQPIPLLRQSGECNDACKHAPHYHPDWEVLHISDVCRGGKRLVCAGGKHFPKSYQTRDGEWKQTWKYVEHPEEEAMRRKLETLFPQHEIRAIHIYDNGCQVRWEAVQASPAPQAMIDAWRAARRQKIKTTTQDTPAKKSKKKGKSKEKKHGDAYTVAAAETDF